MDIFESLDALEQMPHIRDLLDRGAQFYDDQKLESAIFLYQAALQKTISEKVPRVEVVCRLKLANAQMQLGNLHDALKTLIWTHDIGPKDSCKMQAIFEMRMRSAEIAQQIPLPLQTVETLYKDVEYWGHAAKKTARFHEMYVLKSRFLAFQGEWDVAYEMARQALSAKQRARDADMWYGQVWDYHLDNLVTLCVALGRHKEARTHIEDWGRYPDQMPQNRQVRYLRCLAEVAAIEGDLEQAIDHASHALRLVSTIDYEEVCASVLETFCRICAKCDAWPEARQALCAFSASRRSERSYVKRSIWLWLANSLATTHANSLRCESVVDRAFGAALRHSKLIDSRLATDFWMADAQRHHPNARLDAVG